MIRERKITADASIDPTEARRRLEKLCELLERATAVPCGSFGNAAAAAVEDPAGTSGRDAFAKYVNDSYAYPKSLERTVYGAAPEFERVFGEGSPELAFHVGFAGLVEITSTGKTEYALR